MQLNLSLAKQQNAVVGTARLAGARSRCAGALGTYKRVILELGAQTCANAEVGLKCNMVEGSCSNLSRRTGAACCPQGAAMQSLCANFQLELHQPCDTPPKPPRPAPPRPQGPLGAHAGALRLWRQEGEDLEGD